MLTFRVFRPRRPDGPGHGEEQRLLLTGGVVERARRVVRLVGLVRLVGVVGVVGVWRGGRAAGRQHTRVHASALRQRHHLHAAQRPAHLDAVTIYAIDRYVVRLNT